MQIRKRRLLYTLALVLSTGVCVGSEDDGAFIKRFAGEPYTGELKVLIKPPHGPRQRQSGLGSAHFVGNGQETKLVVFGAIDDEKGDAGFAIDGRYEGDVWKAGVGTIELEILRTGRIRGGGAVDPQKFDFSGVVSDSAFDLAVTIELLEPTKNGMPVGTTFRFEYDLSRADPNRDNRPAKAKRCRQIRYEMRPVANIGEGTMSMLRVPVCLS